MIINDTEFYKPFYVMNKNLRTVVT